MFWNAQKWHTEGVRLLRENQFNAAIDAFTKSIDKGSGTPLGAYYNRALAIVGKVQEEAPQKSSEEEAVAFANRHLNLAIADLSNAVEYLKIFGDQGEFKIVDFYMARVDCHILMQEVQKGFADLNEVIRLEPNNADAYQMRGYFHLDKMDDPATAIGDLSRAITIMPSAQSYLTRAWAYLDLNDEEKAGADFERAIRLDPVAKTADRSRSIYRFRMWEHFRENFLRTHPRL